MSEPVLNILIDVAIHEPSLDRLKAMPGMRVAVTDTPDQEIAANLPDDQVRDLDILFCTYLPKNHQHMERLKYLQIGSAGYEQLRGQGLPGRHLRACNASGVFDTSIAEWNIAMMVNLARDLMQMIRNQEAAHWERDSPKFQRSIRGSVVGLWGYGGLARQTARLAKALGLVVHVLTRDGVKPRPNTYVVPESGDPEGTLPDREFTSGQETEFLSSLDFLVVALPLNAHTRGLIGDPQLKALPRRAFVLNPARGPLIEEGALLRALEERQIAGAALDAHYHYPMPPDHPLWRFPNVIMTPHISGSALGEYYVPRIWDIFMQNLERLRTGQPLLNELSAAQLGG